MVADRIGETLGNYTLVRLLGQGSFAEVYLGEHRYLERPAAIKVLHVRMEGSQQEAFRREARTIAQLRHPHIIGVHDFGIEDQTPYLVMEYTPSGTLRSCHPRGTCLPFEQIVIYVKQIASALDYAHAQHIIHRDIKPENILLGANQEVVLSDFGIAVVQRTLDSLSTQELAGTPFYMAPEQIQRQACAASDQYALGVMVYEWVCGEPPFRGSLYEVFSHHLHEPPPSLRVRLPDLPAAVDDAVMGALAKDPQHRFLTVQDFATVLEEACFATQPLSLQVAVDLREQEEITRPLVRVTPLSMFIPSMLGLPQESTQPRLEVVSRSEHGQAGGASILPAVPRETISKPAKLSVAQTNRQRLLRRVRSFWITGVLEQSLHGAALMALGLKEQPDAVANPWHLVLQHPETTPTPLPAGTRITQVYDEADGELLILGAPGSGKTTLLLELARDLLARAEQDEQHPIPVVFSLSSWALTQQSLVDWLVEELNTKYQVPRTLATTLLETEQILPLLDGLDEVATKDRTLCIETINRYRREHGTLPLVVCSRSTDYLTQTSRVLLGSAVQIQPLSPQHVEQALRTAGPAFSGLRAALQQQQALQDLTTTPLMLNVLLLTYQGVSVEAIVQGKAELEQRVWTDYVARMVRPRGMKAHASLEDTRHWLTSLAKQMRVHQQTIFYAEYMQATWLTNAQQRTMMWLTIRVPAIVLGVLASLLVGLFLGNIYFAFQPQIGLLGGFIGGCVSSQVVAGTPHTKSRFLLGRPAYAINALLFGLLVVAGHDLTLLVSSDASFYSLMAWISGAYLLALGSGLSFWTFQKLLGRLSDVLSSQAEKSSSQRGQRTTWFTTLGPLPLWQAAVTLGAGVGLSLGLSSELRMGIEFGLFSGSSMHDALIYELVDALRSGQQYTLVLSTTVVLLYIIFATSLKPLHFVERVTWTWRGLIRRGHLRTSLLIAGAVFLIFGLGTGFSWLCLGLRDGMTDASPLKEGLRGYRWNVYLEEGLTAGLHAALSVGLSYWILLGLYHGMKQEQLEDQDRSHFNQGIRRSLRNGLPISLLSSSIITSICIISTVVSPGLSGLLISNLMGGLRYGLSFGLSRLLSSENISWLISTMNDELSNWLIFEQKNAWILLFAGIVLIWTLSGALTILRHYVIRWILARSHRFPWRAQAFLDEAAERNLLQRVGGGYRFMHRRLLDYFASLDDPSPPASPDHTAHHVQQPPPIASHR